MIPRQMPAQTPSKSRISAATIALSAAAILVVGAVGYRVVSGGDAEEAPTGNNVVAAADAGSLDDTIAAMRERLRQDPDNHEMWFMLGLASRDNGQFPQAEQAFRRAMELSPRTADYTAYLAEVLLLQATRARQPAPAEAEQLLRRTLEIEPANPQARFYLATLKDQGGDHEGAVNDMIAILRDAPAGAAWPQQVRDSVISIARQNNINVEGRLPELPAGPAPSTATAAIPGPTREQMDAARGLPPSQQDEMVKGMVDRLEARLQANPRDADRWMMLMRSRMVMNDRPGATQALRNALAAFNNDAATQTRLRAAAAELGVPNPS